MLDAGQYGGWGAFGVEQAEEGVAKRKKNVLDALRRRFRTRKGVDGWTKVWVSRGFFPGAGVDDLRRVKEKGSAKAAQKRYRESKKVKQQQQQQQQGQSVEAQGNDEEVEVEDGREQIVGSKRRRGRDEESSSAPTRRSPRRRKKAKGL